MFEEFNKLFEDFIEQSSNVQDLEHFEILGTEKIAIDNRVTTESGAGTGKPQKQYTYNQLDHRVATVSQLKGPRKRRIYRKSP